MNHLKVYKFSSLYRMSSGISSTPDQAGKGSPFLSFKTVFSDYFLPSELDDLMYTSEKEQEVYSIKEGDIFLTRTSESLNELGMSSVAFKSYPKATYSGFLKRLRPIQKDLVYYKYIAFYLRSNLFRSSMNNNAIMTLRASLNEQIFSYLNIVLPSFENQKAIGDLLFDIYLKIQTNSKINDNLERMAKTLYDYWFVQFDFPDENGKPYKSSGGKMIWNEILKRKIPEGWEVKNLFQTTKVQYGFPFSTEYFNEDGKGYPVIRIRDILNNSNYNYSNQKNIDLKYLIEKGDILVGMDGNFHINYWSKDNCYLNQRVVMIKETFLPNIFTRYQIEPYIQLREKSVSRTTVGHLSDKDLKAINLLVPPNEILKNIKPLFDDILKKHISNKIQNQQLSSLRDWLLPMLMNGQVKIE